MSKHTSNEMRRFKTLRARMRAMAAKHGHKLAPFPEARYVGDWMGSHCVECGATVKVNCRTNSTEHDGALEQPCKHGLIFGAPSVHAKSHSGKFGPNSYAGDMVQCFPAPGLRAYARIERDDDATPPDERSDGYWPSLNPNSAGYIGKVSERTFKRHMQTAKDWLEAWKKDEWFYCGVVVTIEDNNTGEQLTEKYNHAVWGVEANHPNDPDNNYLIEVANDCLADALAAIAEKRKEAEALKLAAFGNVVVANA